MAEHWKDDDQADWPNSVSVDLRRGHGRFTGPRQMEVRTPGGGTVRPTARQVVVVAVGTDAALPDLPGLDAVRLWTSREVDERRSRPQPSRRGRWRCGGRGDGHGAQAVACRSVVPDDQRGLASAAGDLQRLRAGAARRSRAYGIPAACASSGSVRRGGREASEGHLRTVPGRRTRRRRAGAFSHSDGFTSSPVGARRRRCAAAHGAPGSAQGGYDRQTRDDPGLFRDAWGRRVEHLTPCRPALASAQPVGVGGYTPRTRTSD